MPSWHTAMLLCSPGCFTDHTHTWRTIGEWYHQQRQIATFTVSVCVLSLRVNINFTCKGVKDREGQQSDKRAGPKRQSTGPLRERDQNWAEAGGGTWNSEVALQCWRYHPPTKHFANRKNSSAQSTALSEGKSFLRHILCFTSEEKCLFIADSHALTLQRYCYLLLIYSCVTCQMTSSQHLPTPHPLSSTYGLFLEK